MSGYDQIGHSLMLKIEKSAVCRISFLCISNHQKEEEKNYDRNELYKFFNTIDHQYCDRCNHALRF